jgi:hypothetical protein
MKQITGKKLKNWSTQTVEEKKEQQKKDMEAEKMAPRKPISAVNPARDFENIVRIFQVSHVVTDKPTKAARLETGMRKLEKMLNRIKLVGRA